MISFGKCYLNKFRQMTIKNTRFWRNKIFSMLIIKAIKNAVLRYSSYWKSVFLIKIKTISLFMQVLELVWIFSFFESAQPLQSGVHWEKLSTLNYNNVQYPIKIITGEKLILMRELSAERTSTVTPKSEQWVPYTVKQCWTGNLYCCSSLLYILRCYCCLHLCRDEVNKLTWGECFDKYRCYTENIEI